MKKGKVSIVLCRNGDIIVVENYKSHGKDVERHPFVVINDSNGQIKGLSFDLVCLVMSSIKNDSQKQKKMKYPGNYFTRPQDFDITKRNNKDGYIKAEQFYYFQKDYIDYTVIGAMKPESFNLLMSFVKKLSKDGIEFEYHTDNLVEFYDDSSKEIGNEVINEEVIPPEEPPGYKNMTEPCKDKNANRSV